MKTAQINVHAMEYYSAIRGTNSDQNKNPVSKDGFL
jgi:hypothetical protein